MRRWNQQQHAERTAFARLRRSEHTESEQLVWAALRGNKIHGVKFRREVVIGPYLVDFACHEFSLIIEIDGSSHDTKGEYDKARQSWLEEQGFRVIRFSHLDVMKELLNVIDGIKKVVMDQKLKH